MTRALLRLAQRATRVYAHLTVPLQQPQQQAQHGVSCTAALSIDAMQRLAVCTSALCALQQQQQQPPSTQCARHDEACTSTTRHDDDKGSCSRSCDVTADDSDTAPSLPSSSSSLLQQQRQQLSCAARVCAQQLLQHAMALPPGYVLPLHTTLHTLRVLRCRRACGIMRAVAAQQLLRCVDAHMAHATLSLWSVPWLLDALQAMATAAHNVSVDDVDKDDDDAAATAIVAGDMDTTRLCSLALLRGVLQSLQSHVAQLTARQTATLLMYIAALNAVSMYGEVWRLACRRCTVLLRASDMPQRLQQQKQRRRRQHEDNNNNNSSSGRCCVDDDVLALLVRAMVLASSRVVYAAHTELLQTLCDVLAQRVSSRHTDKANNNSSNNNTHNNNVDEDDDDGAAVSRGADADDDFNGDAVVAAMTDIAGGVDDVVYDNAPLVYDVDDGSSSGHGAAVTHTREAMCRRLRLRLLLFAGVLPARALLEVTRDVLHMFAVQLRTHTLATVHDDDSSGAADGGGSDGDVAALRARMHELCSVVTLASRGWTHAHATHAAQWLQLARRVDVCVRRANSALAATTRTSTATHTHVAHVLASALAALCRCAVHALAHAHTTRRADADSSSNRNDVNDDNEHAPQQALLLPHACAAAACNAHTTLSALLHFVADASVCSSLSPWSLQQDAVWQAAVYTVAASLLRACTAYIDEYTTAHTDTTATRTVLSSSGAADGTTDDADDAQQTAAVLWCVAVACDVFDAAGATAAQGQQQQQQHTTQPQLLCNGSEPPPPTTRSAADVALAASCARARASVLRCAMLCSEVCVAAGACTQQQQQHSLSSSPLLLDTTRDEDSTTVQQQQQRTTTAAMQSAALVCLSVLSCSTHTSATVLRACAADKATSSSAVRQLLCSALTGARAYAAWHARMTHPHTSAVHEATTQTTTTAAALPHNNTTTHAARTAATADVVAMLRLLCGASHAATASLRTLLLSLTPLLANALDAHTSDPALLTCMTQLLTATHTATARVGTVTGDTSSTTSAAAAEATRTACRHDAEEDDDDDDEYAQTSRRMLHDAVLELYVRLLLACRVTTLTRAHGAALLRCLTARGDDAAALERGFALLLTRRLGSTTTTTATTAAAAAVAVTATQAHETSSDEDDRDACRAATLLPHTRLPLSTLARLLACARVLRRASRPTSIAIVSALLSCAVRSVDACSTLRDCLHAATLLTLGDDDEDVAVLLRDVALAEAIRTRAGAIARAAVAATTAAVEDGDASSTRSLSPAVSHASALQKAQLIAYLLRADVSVDEELLASLRAMPSSA